MAKKPTSSRTGAGSSPASTGPAGGQFEGQVAAHYLLTMLAEAEPRGLPGTTVERVALQRSGEGHPLDDVIVHARTHDGRPVRLDIQVKRSATFAPEDPVFRDVAVQLAQSVATLDTMGTGQQFAIAIERTSARIAGPYQDVLRWARELGDAATFLARLGRPKVASEPMRTFVATLRKHLEAAGGRGDDDMVWQLLRRCHILAFDYDAPGSQSRELALERAARVLAPSHADQAGKLWRVLTERAIAIAASGGDRDRVSLVHQLSGEDHFALAGSPRNAAIRSDLADASRLAASELRRTVAGATLARADLLDAVRGASDQGRYVEIRGEAGVGKSGLLALLIDQAEEESRTIVLSPGRTIPRGWLGFKSALHIDGGPRAFLSDLASDGGGTLFVDSLDFFTDPGERKTVFDLVAEAAAVPGFRVIVTARADFDKDEPNWLSPAAIAALGAAPPIVIAELGEAEVEELRVAAPALRALLADDHPARAVVRNLFRLSRIADHVSDATTLRSEIDMCDRWWKSGDGEMDAGTRQRVRLLADLADAVIAGNDRIESRAPPEAVAAFLASGSIRELARDQLSFRHDVMRDWAVAMRLQEAPAQIASLDLARPVPASLARGIELAGRAALERATDGAAWLDLLDRLGGDSAHPSWRRAALLAVLRSDIAPTVLARAGAVLLEANGVLLRELIRTALAAESAPLRDLFAGAGVAAEAIPAGLFGPSNGSWTRLICWLLVREADLPAEIWADACDLFQGFATATFTLGEINIRIAEVLAGWLTEVEGAQEIDPRAPEQPRVARAIRYRDLSPLADQLRTAFFLLANRVPETARGYLLAVRKRRHPDTIIREIVAFSGSLAQAAPAELADLTAYGLIAGRPGRARGHRQNDPFTLLDSQFLPAAPDKGPFLALLNAAPGTGLGLIRRLVDTAIAARAGTAAPGADGVTLIIDGRPRFFPWTRSYFWSREGDGHYAVECALMALEAWSHQRFERGDPIDAILTDILGPEGAPAAYVLVAVDILLSHWPKTQRAMAPFLGSPELLALDHGREGHERAAGVELEGIGLPRQQKSAAGLDLHNRPSRGRALEQALAYFMKDDGSGDRDVLRASLEAGAARLGAPGEHASYGDPAFMARYALNITDPANWRPYQHGLAYVAPPAEAEQIARLTARFAPHHAEAGTDAALYLALEDSTRSGPELAERAVALAKARQASPDAPDDAIHSRGLSILTAALIAVRDGTDRFIAEQSAWAREVFLDALGEPDDPARGGMRNNIRYNPVAIATLGLLHLWRRDRRAEDREALLRAACRAEANAAYGFGAGRALIEEVDGRLIRSALRCGLAGQISEWVDWHDGEEEPARAEARRALRHAEAVAAELAWLDGGDEPSWPVFPSRAPLVRRGIRIGVAAEDFKPEPVPENPILRVSSQGAALWLRQLTAPLPVEQAPWLAGLIAAYLEWTAEANGAGLDAHVEIERAPREWSDVFFALLVQMVPLVGLAGLRRQFGLIVTLPDQPFFDAAEDLFRAVDRGYFSDKTLDADAAIELRGILSRRIFESNGWPRAGERLSFSIETHIAPAIAAMFMNAHNPLATTSAYILEKGIDRIDPFFPTWAHAIETGPVPYVAMLVLNLLEVSPRPAHASFLLTSAAAWLRRVPDNAELWVGRRTGARIALLLEQMARLDPALLTAGHPTHAVAIDVLARLVRAGVAEAYRIEALLLSDGSHQLSEGKL